MIILSENGIEAKARLNTAMIDSNGIMVDCNVVHVPYNDTVLREELGVLAFRLGSQNDRASFCLTLFLTNVQKTCKYIKLIGITFFKTLFHKTLILSHSMGIF